MRTRWGGKASKRPINGAFIARNSVTGASPYHQTRPAANYVLFVKSYCYGIASVQRLPPQQPPSPLTSPILFNMSSGASCKYVCAGHRIGDFEAYVVSSRCYERAHPHTRPPINSPPFFPEIMRSRNKEQPL
jgi:hypothetical protein